jgi:CheY-like chemotaxis protein
MDNTRILWVDDEVENLKPHIIFLESKGFQVLTATNGSDALSILGENIVDAVLLDEHMPGQSGLDILPDIKILRPSLAIIMVTKSEEEGLMEQAIGEDIADYLLKPVQPRQILSSLMRLLDRKQLVSDRSISAYQSGFRELSESINDADSWTSWTAVYKELIKWDKKLSGSDAESMRPMLDHQKEEANRIFSRFWAENYSFWLNSSDSPCDFSHQIFQNKVSPHVKSGKKSVVLIFDNLRLDQWLELQPFFNESFRIESDELYASILPTATQYARNSLISGLLPLELSNKYPQYWVPDVMDADGGRNANESFFLSKWAEKEKN